MAGGEGSRLRPLTVARAKPMVPLLNKPVIGHIRDLLVHHGFNDLTVTLQYRAEEIQDYLSTGPGEEPALHFAVEDVPLGTAGSVRNARQFLDDTFLVISGDAVTDIDLRRAVEFHRERDALVTIVLYRVPDPLDYGVIITEEDGRVRHFLEKPSWGEVVSDTVNTGIYVVEPSVLEEIEPGKAVDWSKEVFPRLVEKGARLYGHVAEGYWTDVGDIAEYMRASFDAVSGRVRLYSSPPDRDGHWLEEEVEIAPDAILKGPMYLGPRVKVKGAVTLGGPLVVRGDCVVDNRAVLERAIVWRNSYIGEGAEVRGAIIGRNVSVKQRAVIGEGAVVADACIVGDGATIVAGVKIWPRKEVEPGAMVTSTLIWGSQGRRVLFGRYGVTGLVNVDMTPEFAASLGSAFGSVLPKGARVVVNRDVHRSSRMIKRAMIAGLPAAGSNAMDTRNVPIPVARYYTRVTDAAGGIHVRLSPYDQRVVDVRFFAPDGLNLSRSMEREVEKVFFREDFRRVYLEDVGTIRYAPAVGERYTQDFLANMDVEAVRRAAPRLVVDYAYAPPGLILPEILSALNCNVVALSARLDEAYMSVPRSEFEAALRQLALIVSPLKVRFGARLDVGGEKLFLVDERGQYVPEMKAAGAMALLAWRAHGGGTVAVPASAPRLFEALASACGGQVLRTKVDPQALMEAAAGHPEVILAADGTGHFVLPAFHPAADAMFALAKLVEYTLQQETSVSQAVAELPPYFTAHEELACPWERKGSVMRRLHEVYPDEAVDGVQVGDARGRALVLPDPDRPIFHVYAEADSVQAAQELAVRTTRTVESIRDDVPGA